MNSKSSLAKALLLSGLLVGVLDAIAACVSAYIPGEISPVRVWQYVASGVFGPEAYNGGGAMAAVGLLFHFIIAMSWTAFFFLIYPKFKFLSKNRILAGMVYGIIIMFAMKYVVVPLSNVAASNSNTISIPQLFIHMFVIGLTISLLTHRHYSRCV